MRDNADKASRLQPSRVMMIRDQHLKYPSIPIAQTEQSIASAVRVGSSGLK